MKDTRLNRKLSALIELSSNVKVYVPSTVGNIGEVDNAAKVGYVLSELSTYFGGATSYQALGCWQSPKGLVKEKVTICQSYCTENQLQENIDKVVEICEGIKKDFQQEAVSLEINNKLYLI